MTEVNPDSITYFGETNFRNERKRFGIKRRDRSKHMYIIGKTGMGKTTLLENMAIQDIVSGEGLGIIDPHGEFAEKMLRFVPESRIKDVVYFAPHDTDWPIAFNIMEDVEPEKRHLVSSGLIGVFKKIWPDVWSARMEYILSNAILALLEYPDSTLLGINRMLSDKDYRNEVVNNVKDPVVKAFWTEEFAKYSDKFMTEAGAAIQNKVGQFAANPLIRNIIGQTKSTIDMREIMDKRKILIMNLSKGRIGEDNSRLIGAMLITKVYLAAMGRVDVPEEERKDFYLYVDEFQNFATESFKDILAEARKYRLNLILAHQYITQMEEPVRDAVLGNIGTLVSFRVGAFDADIFEKEFAPEFMALDIVNLGFAQIYLRLMIDGVASRPFSSMTLPPIHTVENSHIAEIVDFSRNAYALPRNKVEEIITKWHEPIKKNNTEIRFGNSGGGGYSSGDKRSFTPAFQQPRRSESPALPARDYIPRPKNPLPQAVSPSNSTYNKNNFSSSQSLTMNPVNNRGQEFRPSVGNVGNYPPRSNVFPKPESRTVSLKDLKAKEKPATQNLSGLREALKGIVKEQKSEDKLIASGEVQERQGQNSSKENSINQNLEAISPLPTKKQKINFRHLTEDKKGKILNPGDKVQF